WSAARSASPAASATSASIARNVHPRPSGKKMPARIAAEFTIAFLPRRATTRSKEGDMDRKVTCPWCGREVERVDGEYARHYRTKGEVCVGTKREIREEKGNRKEG